MGLNLYGELAAAGHEYDAGELERLIAAALAARLSPA
jgi:hypothetical protein